MSFLARLSTGVRASRPLSPPVLPATEAHASQLPRILVRLSTVAHVFRSLKLLDRLSIEARVSQLLVLPSIVARASRSPRLLAQLSTGVHASPVIG